MASIFSSNITVILLLRQCTKMMHSSPQPNGKFARALQAPGGACRARQNFPGALRSDGAMRRWTLFAAATALALTLGCTTLDERQRAWILQPSDRAWGSTAELARSLGWKIQAR